MASIPSPDERYIKLEQKNLPDGTPVYKPAIPINVVGDPTTDVTFIASDQDRMDVMANNQYGSALLWWRIAAANSIANGTVYIKPGTPIIVPSAES
jgi:hypothetical protein